MSSFINKAKAKVEELAGGNQNNSDTYGSSTNHPGYDNPHSGNAGPHSSNVMNKGDPRVDSDYDHRNDPTSRVGGAGQTQQYGDNYGQAGGPGGITTSDTGYGTHAGHTGTTGHTGHTGSTGHTGHAGGLSEAAAAGTGVSGAGTSYTTGTGNTYDNPRSANAGPHSSNLMNKADPRHDSDRDHRNDPTSRVGGYGTQGGDYGHTTGIGGTGVSHGTGTHTGGIGGTGDSYGTGTHTGGIGGTGGSYGTGTHTGGIGGTEGSYGTGHGTTYDNPQSTSAGPHSSNLMNKLDPRHDSDRDHRNDPTSRVGGYGTQGGNYGHAPVHEATTHPTGSGYGSGTTEGYGTGHTGSHGSHGVGHTGTHGTGHTTGTTSGYGDSSYTPGSGNASNTAGPHNSNLLNKLDPRVDSDLDGSKTYGGNQTHR